MSNNIKRINELEGRIKELLLKNPNIARQIIDNILDRGLFAIGKQNPDLITASECLVVTKLLLDISNRD